MPYMIYQQYKTAVVDGYGDRPDKELRRQAEQASRFRAWLETLAIAPDIRNVLVEQIQAIEEAFEEMLRDPQRSRHDDPPA